MIKQFKPATRRFLVFTLPPAAALIAILTFTAASEPKSVPPKSTAVVTNNSAARLEALEKQFAMETDRVRAMEARVDELRKALKIFAVTEADLSKESATLQQIERDRILAEREYLENKELLSELKKKDRSDLVHSLPAGYRDETLQRLLENREKSEQNFVLMKSDYTDEHAEVRRLQALIKVVNKQIDDRMKGILSGFESTVASKKAVVEHLAAQRYELKKIEGELLEQARPYFTAKRDLEIHQKMRDSVYLRLLEARADSELKN